MRCIVLAVVLALGLVADVRGHHAPFHPYPGDVVTDVDYAPVSHVGATFTLAHATSTHINWGSDRAHSTIDFVPGGIVLNAAAVGNESVNAHALIELAFTTAEPLVLDYRLDGALHRMQVSGPGIAIDHHGDAAMMPWINGGRYLAPILLEPGEYSFRLVLHGPDGFQHGFFSGTITNPAVVPEPSTLVLAAVALLGALGLLRRHRRVF